jgi:hypothetical protein
MMRKYAMVIDDVTAHVNRKHLVYDETMCHSARIGVKTLKMPGGVNATDLARTVYSGIPDDVIFID